MLANVDAAVSDCATPPVLKDHFLLSLKALCARSVAPVEIVATYLVEVARSDDGSKVAVLPSRSDTVPPSFVVVSAILKVNVLGETEVGNIGSLNVTLISELT